VDNVDKWENTDCKGISVVDKLWITMRVYPQSIHNCSSVIHNCVC